MALPTLPTYLDIRRNSGNLNQDYLRNKAYSDIDKQ
jgi:hypothetical protein